LNDDRRPHAIIATSFGTRTPPEGDPVNERLAEISDLAAAHFRVPQILQWEIARYSQANPQLVIEPTRGKYLDTRQFMIEAKTFCDERYLTKVIVVAGALHAYRAERTAMKLGFEVVGTFTTSEIWDSQSEQWWTRGPLRNLTREIPASLYYKMRGWI
jgi:hypothetical protein